LQAALCVAKLFDISPAIVRTQGFIDNLRDLLSDPNPAVVANAVAALTEVQESTGKEVFEITGAVLVKLLAALNECTEWGQVFILDALAKYTPGDAREAENIIERVTPRLVHQNPAVVLSAVKIVLMYMEVISNVETINSFCRKLAPPIITLAQSPQPEVQYVALRNINLIVQKRPNLLSHKIKVFFCKYNDPIYVKMEKLDILVKLANDKNVDQVLLELKEYATEVDVEYVRRAVRTIGRLAIKLDVAAEKCIKVLLQLIATKVNYVVQEAIVVIKDIFRRYPNRYESIIGVLCQSLESLDEPEAKASMIWIIGEYAERIDNAAELLETFMSSFHDETTTVQLQLLTATVKLFLKRPADSEALVSNILSMATEHSDNPDLRDRGYIYWRLLSTDPDAAKAVVLAERPVIQDDTSSLEPALLDLLTRNLSNLASVYHKPPESFVKRVRQAGVFDEEGLDDEDEENFYGDDVVTGTEAEVEARTVAPGAVNSTVSDDDLLGIGSYAPAPAVTRSAPAPAPAPAPAGGLDDLFGSAPAHAPSAAVPDYPVVCEKDGLVVRAGLARRGGNTVFDITIEHRSGSAPVAATALKFNRNILGAAPASVAVNFNPIAPGSKGSASVPLLHDPSLVQADASSEKLQVALRDNASSRVAIFEVGLNLLAFYSEDGAVDKGGFVESWKNISGPDNEIPDIAREVATLDQEGVKSRLQGKRIFFIAARPGPDASLAMLYFSARAYSYTILYELTFKTGVPAIKVVTKSTAGGGITRAAGAAIKAALA
jgi:AP-1 complex subunit beta-1